MVCLFFLFDNRHGSFVKVVEKKEKEFFVVLGGNVEE